MDPRVTIGLLTDQEAFPLTVSASEGYKADTQDDAAVDRVILSGRATDPDLGSPPRTPSCAH